MSILTPSPIDTLAKLLINRDFGFLWIGQTISGVGDFFFDTTLILWMTTGVARGQVWLPLAVSGVVLSSSIPQLVVGPLAGVFVDRWDKRSTMLWMDATRAILVATGLLPLPFGANAHLPLVWKLGSIYGVIVLLTCCAQFFSPARLALTADIVPDAERAHGVSMGNISFNTALIIAPTLAALLFLAFGAAWAIVIDALSFVISFLFVFLIRPPEAARSVVPGEKGNYFHELVDGLRFLRGNRVLMVLLVAGIIFNLGTGTFNAFYLLFALDYAHAPVKLSGLFAASYGGAVILGSIVAVMLAKRIGEGRLFWFSIATWGVLLLPFARMTSFLPALLLNCLLGLSNAGINVVVGPLLMRFTLREYIGWISAVFGPIIQAAQFLSVMIAGFVASTLLAGLHTHVFGMIFRPVDTVFTGAGLLALQGVNLKPNVAQAEE
jgi:MFS family permease